VDKHPAEPSCRRAPGELEPVHRPVVAPHVPGPVHAAVGTRV